MGQCSLLANGTPRNPAINGVLSLYRYPDMHGFVANI
jgi:hypothetical protein